MAHRWDSMGLQPGLVKASFGLLTKTKFVRCIFVVAPFLMSAGIRPLKRPHSDHAVIEQIKFSDSLQKCFLISKTERLNDLGATILHPISSPLYHLTPLSFNPSLISHQLGLLN